MQNFKKFPVNLCWALLTATTFFLSSPSKANDAESISLTDPTLTVSVEGGWVAHADVQVNLSPVLIEAVQRGVPLYFVSEFELRKSRWWWFDKKIFSQSKTVRLSYHAVTQQFRVAVGGLHQLAHESLEKTLAAAVSMRAWQLKDPGELVEGIGAAEDWSKSNLEARLRVRLDSARLPKPLQINAITNRDWNLSSDWVEPKVLIKASGSANR